MKQPTQSRLALVALVALFAACGDNLIADPSFDLWCNGKLCKPWQATGKVSRVKTWHTNDYGVSLSDGALLSQLSMHARVDCIAFEVIADVSASADVTLEMDFRDDDSSEYVQQVAESHWAKLRYLVKTPTWYDSVRFIMRKKGKGRAVLAQIKATPSDECNGDAIPLLDRPKGATCAGENVRECSEPTSCVRAPNPFALGLSDPKADMPAYVCGECNTTVCEGDELCSVKIGDAGAYPGCIAKGSLHEGDWCLHDDDCTSKKCSTANPATHATCAQCDGDEDCASGEICGVDIVGAGAARSCHADTTRKLGELCAVDAECKSGVCCEGACSECCKEHACKGGEKCGFAAQEWLTSEASLCAPGEGKRKPGEACTDDTDCALGECKEPDAICNLCLGADCKSDDTSDCGFLRKLTGTCR